MSVRKRTWTRNGITRESWVVDYVDQHGDRHIETFARKKDADARHAVVKVDVSKGVHTPVNRSITVAAAADDWIAFIEGEARERATVAQYKIHVEHHIVPRIGNERLASLTAPRVEAFRDELLRDLSRPMAKKVLVSFKSILKDAQRRGNVAQNVATGTSIKIGAREQLKVGVDIPSTEEISRILAAATGRWRPFLIVAIFTGLRGSELRGLRWADVDLKAGKLSVRQKADRYNEIGKPKSKASAREIPIGPFVVNSLKEWRLQNPHELVFPTTTGNIEYHTNIVQRVLIPVQIAAGVVTAEGKAKYGGLHALRHFYASWCINRKEDGGLGLTPKMVQARLGHAGIAMTLDRYGHLFPSDDKGTELAEAERRLLR
jgi:integrase